MTIPTSGTVPGWAFTIGLGHTFGHPEILMFGLRLGNIAGWLNQLGERVGSGHTLIDEQPINDALPGHACLHDAAGFARRPSTGRTAVIDFVGRDELSGQVECEHPLMPEQGSPLKEQHVTSRIKVHAFHSLLPIPGCDQVHDSATAPQSCTSRPLARLDPGKAAPT
ncbi:MAG: DUF4262 domain-containing protein [Dehalococcoidia bacterium]|nr:DUF4262 domain-containing protein [Dehalococcoidia bacterium]